MEFDFRENERIYTPRSIAVLHASNRHEDYYQGWPPCRTRHRSVEKIQYGSLSLLKIEMHPS